MKNSTRYRLNIKNSVMKAFAIAALLLSLFSFNAKAQTFWTETFTNGCSVNCNATTYTTGPNGPWTVASTGANGAEGSEWYVSCAENGNAAGACGTGCVGADASLHVSSNDPGWAGDLGAAYEIGGFCGFIICIEANLRAESPTINCTPYSGITLAFNYIEFGDGTNDDATLWYFDGATWSLLTNLAKTPCCGGPCTSGSLQGQWTAFSIALPASANNNPNVKIGFNWTNNDDGIGWDPSFAVDDITLSVPTSNTITTGVIAGSPFCACSAMSVPFTSTGTFTAGNIYTAQLSDAVGSFAAPVAIGTLASVANTGTIACTIPCGTPTGTGYRVRVISSTPPITGTDNGVNITINAVVVPSVTIAAVPSGPICAGTSVTFTATPTNGGTTPTYQWQINGTNVGGATSSTFTTTTLANGDIVTVVMTSNAPCPTPATATSTGITMTVNPVVVPSVTIAAVPSGPICAGTSVTFTATPTNGGTTPTYQWQINGTNVGGATSTTFTTTTLANGDIVTVVMTSNATCATPATVTSSGITMTVNPIVVPSVSIVSTGSTICAGDPVTFTATPTNGGTTPTYQWQLNGTNIGGATSSTYTSSTLVNGDIITVIMTSNAPCASPTTATSNPITITVSASVPASVSITSTGATICAGDPVTFTASPTNGGATPTYQWQLNGTNIGGATSSTYTSSTLVNGDIITVIMTSSLSCATGSPATSNAITITVVASVPASVSISAVPSTTICAGDLVVFTATPTNGGATPTYQWQINGTNVGGATSSSFSTTTLANGDVVNVIMTSSSSCATGSPATSNSITITVNPSVTASVSIVGAPTTICVGDPVTFTATPTNGGTPSYQWQVNGTNTGTNSATYTTTGLSNGDVVTVIMTSTAPCVTGSPATSNTVTITVNSCSPPVANFTANNTIFCNTPACVNFTDLSTNSPTSWSWSFPGASTTSSTSQNPTGICYSANGSYDVTLIATNADGSDTLTQTAYITVGTPVTVTVSGNMLINACESTTLYASPSDGTYTWSGESSTGPEVTVSPTVTTTYTVTYTSPAGCTDTETATVVVENIFTYFMPTGFSPNGDGINDVIQVHGKGIDRISLKIFDRIGEKVFETTNPNEGWDGKLIGLKMNNNVFVYDLVVTFCDGSEAKEHGAIIIAR